MKTSVIVLAMFGCLIANAHSQMMFDAAGTGKYYALKNTETGYNIYKWGSGESDLVAYSLPSGDGYTYYNPGGYQICRGAVTTSGYNFYDTNDTGIYFSKMEHGNWYFYSEEGTLMYYSLRTTNGGFKVVTNYNDRIAWNINHYPTETDTDLGCHALFYMMAMGVLE